MAIHPENHLHEVLFADRELGTYRTWCTRFGAPIFQLGLFLWGFWMIFVWICIHNNASTLVIVSAAAPALFCFVLSLVGLRNGILGARLLKKGTFAKGRALSKKRTSLFISGGRDVVDSRRSQDYLWKSEIHFGIPGESISRSFSVVSVSQYGTGAAVQHDVGEPLVLYDPHAPSQAMRLEDIPLNNVFESFETLAPSSPEVKILAWPIIIIGGNLLALVSVLYP